MRLPRRLLSIALLSVFLTALTLADTVTFSESTFAQKQFCGSGEVASLIIPCTPYSLDIPQFDPSLGILQSIAYSLTDLQTVGWGYNDITAPFGISFQVDVTASTNITGLPIGNINISTTFPTLNLKTCQCSQIATGANVGAENSLATLTTSGSFFSPSFIGTGTRPVFFTDAPNTETFPLFPVFSSAVWSEDTTKLDITYKYAAVPEPSQIWLLLIVSAGILAAANFTTARRRSARTKPVD